MRWFKHMTDSSDDEFLEEVEDIFGLSGFARWWKLLEAIGKQMDKTDKCSAEYSWKKWQTILKGKKNKLSTFLDHCENEGKISLELNGNKLRIECPKLLILRDEYSKKSGQVSGQVSGEGPDQEAESKLEVNNKDIEQKDSPASAVASPASNSKAKKPKAKKHSSVVTAQDLVNDYGVDPVHARDYLAVRGKKLLTPTAMTGLLAQFKARNITVANGVYALALKGWVGLQSGYDISDVVTVSTPPEKRQAEDHEALRRELSLDIAHLRKMKQSEQIDKQIQSQELKLKNLLDSHFNKSPEGPSDED